MLLKCAIVLLLLAVACSSSREGLDYLQDEEFQAWISQYSRDGENLAEIYPTWRRNADFVKHQNTLGLSYTLSVNKFAHLDILELVKEQNKVASQLQEWNDPGPRDIPSSVDWRDKGVIPPVVDQGQCDSSNLFSVLDSIDAFWAIEHGHLVLASREECIDCCLKSGCGGGTVDDSSLFECIVRLGGLAKEGEYVSPNHTCLSDKYPPVVKISGSKSVAPSGDEQALAVAVARQPIAVTVDASHTSFQLYDSGVYYEPKCSEKPDHTMLVVGYGSQGGEDFWIVKNSWGESWGMNGYILMARNRNNNCGIATQTVYPY